MNELLLVAGVHLLAVMSPGPDLAVVLKWSLSQGKKSALFTAFGISIGVLVHVFYSIVGLAIIISQSILLFNVIKYIGAAYLLWIGLRSVFSRSKTAETQNKFDKTKKSSLEGFRVGLFTNVLNPKATLFFLSLFTQVISIETSSLTKLGYGLEMTVVTFLWFGLVAIVMTRSTVQTIFYKAKDYIDKLFGTILIGLGLKVALD